jgi:hypothetical protein
MSTIYKYPVELGTFSVKMPKGAIFRSTGAQREGISMWFEVDPDAELEARKFITVETGKEVPANATYLETFGIPIGPLDYVGHVYELNK